jgi:V/A-type H+-transporting ATPase subunit I
MSIAPVVRVVLIGAQGNRAALIEALQAAGLMHIDGLQQAARAAVRSGAAGSERVRRAVKHLATTPRLRAQVERDPAFDVEAFIDAVLANQEQLGSLKAEQEALARRLKDVAPWGDFSFPDSPAALGGQRLWFYRVPLRQLPGLEALALPWRVVHRAEGQAFVVVLSAEEPAPGLIPAPRVHVGARSLKDLEAERARLDLALDEAEHDREALTRRLGLLLRDRAIAQDQSLLELAQALAADADGLFTLSGWVAQDQADALAALATAQGAAAVLAPPAPSEQPPTLLTPPEPVAAGADLLKLYQMPGAREWDPSAVLFGSFSLFFALILSDAGYAAVLLLGLGLGWPLLGRSATGKRLRPLMLTACALALGWGVLVGSYFGAAPPTPWLAQAQLLSLDDFDAMMTLAILVGAGHVAIASLGRAWAERRQRSAWARLGWVVVIAAGVLGWKGGAALQPVAIALGVVGLAGVAAGASGAVQALVDLTAIAKLFSDILSYLRLFALGLASASLAVAFNDLAGQAQEALGGLGLLAAVLVLGVGHALNLALSVAGGIVHGLRLNVIEFLNWGLAEEGRPFVAFARTARPSAKGA